MLHRVGMAYRPWKFIAVAAATFTQPASAKVRVLPTLSVDVSALSDEVVVYSPRQRNDLILHTIRPPAPDLSALTNGLVAGEPSPPSDPVTNEKRIQAALINADRAK